MSSKSSSRPQGRCRLRGPVLVLVLMASLGPTMAQRKTFFNPAVGFGITATNNVEFGGVNEQDEELGLYLDVDLPVVRVWRGGQLEFSYNPSFLQYNSRDEFNHDEERVKLNITQLNRATGKFDFNTSYTLTQQQGNPLDDDGPDPFLASRTDREKMFAGVNYYYTPNRDWSWNFDVQALFERFSELEDFMPDPGVPVRVQDRDEYTAGVQFNRVLTKRVDLGLGYTFQRSELQPAGTDPGGEENSNSVALSLEHRVADRISVNYQMGAFKNNGSASGPDEERDGILVGFGYEQTFKRFNIGFEAEHSPRSGGALVGATENTKAEFTAQTRLTRRWELGSSILWEERNPVDPAIQNEAILAVGVAVERLFKNTQALRLSYVWVDQWGNQATFEDPATVDVSIGYVWYPLERTSIGRQPAGTDSAGG